jgi:glycosyltransferase involved in cell wall biosynthesis
MISIIIRSRNEERWIKFCLQAIFDQTYSDFEVILVDNNSTDNTVLKAKKFNIRKIVNIGKYRPGLAINEGIRVSSGDYIVCISAHCIPVNNKWLEQLVSNFKDPQIAGVYGRQEPMSFTSNSDKRDLLITFGLDRREQFKDSFFHNANSIFPRKIWKNFPFNEEVTNIEDRLWAEQVLKAGYKIVYDPKASVYHYHGIHHSGNPDRCANVVKILEKLENFHINAKNKTIDIEQLNIIAVIPIREENIYLAGKPLFEYTIQHALKSSYISKVIVSTDNENIAKHAEKIGAEVPFLRDKKHSRFDIILEQLMQYVLIDLETRRIIPDIMVMM